MDILLDNESHRPLYLQLRDALRTRLLTGVLPGGTRLPATRELANHLHISRNTVEEAYGMLRDEGLIDIRRGQGAFAVSREMVEDAAQGDEGFAWDTRLSQSVRAIATYRESHGQVAIGGKGVISFASMAPDHHSFEVDAFRHALDDALLREGNVLLSYGYTRGYEPLREYIGEYLAGKGLRMAGQQVLIVNGFRQGAGAVLRALCEPGDSVAIEAPTYNGFLAVLKANRINALPIECDGDGMLPQALEQAIQRDRPKLLYIVPTYHNPTGRNMPLKRRVEILSLAQEHGLPVLEDGFSEELRFAGESYPALKALPGADGVIYVSSFSKVLFPGLRIGWAVAPQPVFDAMTHLKYSDDISSPPLLQAALVDYLKRGGLERHLRRTRPAYRARMDALYAALDAHFKGRATYTRSEGGFGAWIRFPDGFDSRQAMRKAREKNVLIMPGDAFFPDGEGGAPYMRLGFSRLTEQQIKEGIAILSDVIREMGF